MSRENYCQSRRLGTDHPNVQFQAILMWALWSAQGGDLERLKSAFPEAWEELSKRYHNPSGYLDEEILEAVKTAKISADNPWSTAYNQEMSVLANGGQPNLRTLLGAMLAEEERKATAQRLQDQQPRKTARGTKKERALE